MAGRKYGDARKEALRDLRERSKKASAGKGPSLVIQVGSPNKPEDDMHERKKGKGKGKGY